MQLPRSRSSAGGPGNGSRVAIDCGREKGGAGERHRPIELSRFLESWLGCSLAEVLSSCTGARSELDRHAAILERHFDVEQHAADHALVEGAEMTDAEHLAGDLVEASSE